MRATTRSALLAVAATAALAFSLTACNDSNGTKDTGAGDSSASAPASTAPGNSAASNGSSASTSGKPAAGGGGNQGGSTGTATGSDSSSQRDGTNTGTDSEGTYTGTLTYLADHKMMVGNQAFWVQNSTNILGAAAICGSPDGRVSVDDTGAANRKCTYDDLVKAAKMGTVKVKVKVLKDSDHIAVSVAEIYHP
ncbi:hypothetical protein ACQB60_40640 [Actinomycetota bacterium Odt1-20B]